MRRSTTSWEGRVRKVPVSTTTSPVTQTADVAVKRASTRERGLVKAFKSHIRKVPAPISNRNPPAMVLSMGREL
jgi:hypothetical protein